VAFPHCRFLTSRPDFVTRAFAFVDHSEPISNDAVPSSSPDAAEASQIVQHQVGTVAGFRHN
jgi:hypothetical protein